MLQKFKIDKKLLKQLDYGIIFIVIAISLFGCINIFSATQNGIISGYNFYFLKLQLTWIVIGLILVYIILAFDYSVIANYASLIYWSSIGLLIFNNLTSTAIKGSSNWIRIGSRAIQPSEFAKVAMIIMLAKKLSDMEGDINNPKNFFNLVMYAAIPMFLIVIAPDMGMTMVCFFIVLGIFFMAGLNLKVIISGIGGIVGVILIFLNINLSPKYDYMKRRLTSFATPESEVTSSSYQLVQSIIGIGSGGIFGKGFLKGTQIRGGYVPEPSTDFIFAVIGEEWGFVGALGLLILYALLIYKIINTAKASKDIFGSIICVGVVSGLMFSIIQNVGMTIGIMPISGITLPFVSYGGSSMISHFISLVIYTFKIKYTYVSKNKLEEEMGSYNSQYETYYKSLSKNQYGGGSIYYTGYTSPNSEKYTNKGWFAKRLTQELIGVFILILFVLTCRIIITPKTQQAYSYAKNVVDKSYDYKLALKKVQGVDLKTIESSTTDWLKDLRGKVIDEIPHQ